MIDLGKIDLDDRIPYYLQVKDRLEELIDKQVLKAEEKLPTEAELCEYFGVSRTVIRQALQELEYDGLIHRRKGIGSFVAEPKILESFVQKLSGFYDDMAAQNLEVHSTVLKNELMPASPRVAKYLGLAPDSPVVVLERLRFVRDEPVHIVTSYLPHALCPEVLQGDFRNRSLYRFLEEHGFFLAHGYRIIESVRASDKEASLLNVEASAPMLLIDSIGYLADGTPIEYYHAVHRGDRTRFRVELVRVRDQKTPGAAQVFEPEPSMASTIEILFPDSTARSERER
jgi:GntR family transcriptional regulator